MRCLILAPKIERHSEKEGGYYYSTEQRVREIFVQIRRKMMTTKQSLMFER